VSANFDIVILGLSITSSWGNGHATTYRGLVKGLAQREHKVLFLEREADWYSQNCDEPHPQGCVTVIYQSFEELISKFEKQIVQARLVIVGSYVPEGIEIGNWITSVAKGHTAFYDIDTPVTMSLLEKGAAEYLTPELISRYDAYFSFTGGPILRRIESTYGSPRARALYCTVDQQNYKPVSAIERWDLGYLGTYSSDRQPSLDKLMLEPARQWAKGRFAVAGPQYPEHVIWPENIDRTSHLSPREHPEFYASQRFTLNITRDAMKQAGYSPSVRLFEAGACGAPIISDWWPGLDSIFEIGSEVLVVESTEDVLRCLRDISDAIRREMGDRARRRVRAEHSPLARAKQIEEYLEQMNDDVTSGTAWRHRRAGQISCGLNTGLSSESKRHETGEVPGGGISEIANPGHLHESVGTGSGNGRGDSDTA
jgi:spore maturation protein CgeB